jgi:hypothetical protein
MKRRMGTNKTKASSSSATPFDTPAAHLAQKAPDEATDSVRPEHLTPSLWNSTMGVSERDMFNWEEEGEL